MNPDDTQFKTAKYTTKPTRVSAIRNALDGSNAKKLGKFIGSKGAPDSRDKDGGITFVVFQGTNTSLCRPGDWLVQSAKGDIVVMNDAAFWAAHE